MAKPYLEITYRQGKPLAAYLYLDRRAGDKAARTERHGQWLIDYAANGRAIGIEFTVVGAVDLAAINRVLAASDQPALSKADLNPLVAA
ncbi:MAG: hypothetical protein ABR964_08845 [Tepidisphaeraceae bacterium]|jgi:uncharacterized protein YuzE